MELAGHPLWQAGPPGFAPAFQPSLPGAPAYLADVHGHLCGADGQWLGELGGDLQGPMDSCCFFLVATIFWATAGKETEEVSARLLSNPGHMAEAQVRPHHPLSLGLQLT